MDLSGFKIRMTHRLEEIENALTLSIESGALAIQTEENQKQVKEDVALLNHLHASLTRGGCKFLLHL